MAESERVWSKEATRRTTFLTGLRGKPFAVWVVFFGLLYVGLALLVQGISFVASGGVVNEFFVSLMIFAVIFLVAGVLALRGRRSSFIVSSAISILFLLLFGSSIAEIVSNPAHPAFWLVVSGVPALFLVAIFSLLSVGPAKTGLAQKRYLASPQSTGGLFTVAVIGFVIGSLIIGIIAAGNIERIVGGAGTAADVQIVAGAVNAAVPFDPATFTVQVGEELSWFNGDTLDHTVTSDDGDFDSGLLKPGDRWAMTFSTLGTYAYHCSPHPWMEGTVIVQP